MISDSLVIVGSAYTISHFYLVGREVWTLGTVADVDADRYYEFHNLPSKEPRYDFSNVPIAELKKLGYPLSNSICIMLAHALYENRFKEISVVGSPMRDKEHQKFHSSLAELVGRAKERGILVSWQYSGMDYKKVYMEDGYGN